MRDRLVRGSFVPLLLATSIAMTAGPADATVAAHLIIHETFAEESVDEPGCHEQVTIRIEGKRTARDVDVNGGIRVSVTELGIASFTEAGEAFTGHFTRTFTINLPAESIPVQDAVVFTQQFSAAMHGDAGDTAVLHLTAHATVLPGGDVVVAYVILHHSCSG